MIDSEKPWTVTTRHWSDATPEGFGLTCAESTLRFRGESVMKKAGKHGEIVLSAQAKDWNESGYVPSGTSTPQCRADASAGATAQWNESKDYLTL